jgi:hypothetical protein
LEGLQYRLKCLTIHITFLVPTVNTTVNSNDQLSNIDAMHDFVQTAISNRADEVAAITRVVTKTTDKDLNTNRQYAGKQLEFLVIYY